MDVRQPCYTLLGRIFKAGVRLTPARWVMRLTRCGPSGRLTVVRSLSLREFPTSTSSGAVCTSSLCLRPTLYRRGGHLLAHAVVRQKMLEAGMREIGGVVGTNSCDRTSECCLQPSRPRRRCARSRSKRVFTTGTPERPRFRLLTPEVRPVARGESSCLRLVWLREDSGGVPFVWRRAALRL